MNVKIINSRTAAISLLACTVALTGALCGCTLQAPANVNTNNGTPMNVTDKNTNATTSNVNAVEPEGTAKQLDRAATVKGDLIGAQHISFRGDSLTTSLLLEPNITSGLDIDAKESNWTTTVYYIATDDSGNLIGSWVSEPLSYTWTYSGSIEDTDKHNQGNNDLAGATKLYAYVISAKASFADGSKSEWDISNGLSLSANNKDEASFIEKNGISLGSTIINTISEVQRG